MNSIVRNAVWVLAAVAYGCTGRIMRPLISIEDAAADADKARAFADALVRDW
ncbi:MAG TPA: hypothetical protein VFD92_04960 [Candidatus Binatia bacterium]|nr:hypothetical protein [Candidatus Binatia bacterium]